MARRHEAGGADGLAAQISDGTSSREAGTRSGAPCASEQHSNRTAATTMSMAAIRRAREGAVAPQPASSGLGLVCSFGASWCSATRVRSRIPRACAPRRLWRASSRRCGQLDPPAARQDCSSGSSASRHRALLTRPPIGSGGERFLRRRSELWWRSRCAAKNDRQQIAARGSRSGGSAETSSVHRDGPLTGVSIKSSKAPRVS